MHASPKYCGEDVSVVRDPGDDILSSWLFSRREVIEIRLGSSGLVVVSLLHVGLPGSEYLDRSLG